MALPWHGWRPGYDANGQPSSASKMHPSIPQPTVDWNGTFDWSGMNGGSFMGEDVYGSFASMDADLLHLPDNCGNSGMSLVPVYNTVREPADFAVASSSPHQLRPTVNDGQRRRPLRLP